MEIDHFVKAIIANPHDDDARLVFADCLEENGDPRAEMIRLQFQLAEMSRSDPKRRKLRARELELIRKHGTFGEVPAVAKVLSTRGGFIDLIEITSPRFLKHQEEIFSSAPIRGVNFSGRSKRILKLLDSPYLSQLRTIQLKNNNEDSEKLLTILRSEKFADLQDLDIRGEWVTEEAIATISHSPTYSKLRRFRFDSYFGGTVKAIQALADSPYVTQLESLVAPGVDNEACRLIATSSNFANLENLNVSGELSTDGIRDFLSKAGCEGLVSLRLSNNRYYYGRPGPAPKGTPFNIDSSFSKLRNLDIGCGFGSSIVEGILRNFPELETIRLTENMIDDAGAIELAKSDVFKRLHKLYLTNNQITQVGAIALGEARQENKAIKLYLDGNPITQGQAKKLRERFGKSFLSRYHSPNRY